MITIPSLASRAYPRHAFHLLLAIVLLAPLLLGLTVNAAFAAEPSRPTEHAVAAVPVAELERLVATLDDSAERTRLVEQLKGLIAAQRGVQAEADDSLLARLSEHIEKFGEEAMDAVAVVGDAPKLFEWGALHLADELVRKQWGEIAARLAAILAAGLIADRLVSMLLRRTRRQTEHGDDLPILVRLPLALLGAVMRLVPVAAFVAAAYGASTLMRLSGPVRTCAVLLVAAVVGVRVVMVGVDALAAPFRPSLRLLPVDDETAEYLVIWTRRLTGLGIFGTVAAQAALLLGLPRGGYFLMLKSLGLAIATMVVIFILQNRHGVAKALRRSSELPLFGPRVQALQARLADVWHVLAVLYVVAVYVVWAVQVKGGFEFMLRATLLTLVILVLAAGLSSLLARAIDRGFAISQEERERFPLLEARANRYLPILHVVLRGVVAVTTVLALAQAWGLDTLSLLSSETGRRVLSSAISIAVVLVGALVMWELIHGAIERYLSGTDADGNPLPRSGRARTLLPLARNAVFLVLVVLVALIVLSELGVNIAPLLAGAGVIGIAIGFGSQKLVQDIITGAFILFEDTIAVGDAIKVGEHSGGVEAISIRAIRLRDLQGNVHTIPFSAVTTVTNMTKGFNFAVFDVGVAYREDTDAVGAVLLGIGEEMQADAKWGAAMAGPLEVLGVERFDASSVVIRARVKTNPADKWSVSREFNRRLKLRFDELGIEMPFPQTTVWFGEDRKGHAPPLRLMTEAKASVE
jgi:small conductance mechanosensitive channel